MIQQAEPSNGVRFAFLSRVACLNSTAEPSDIGNEISAEQLPPAVDQLLLDGAEQWPNSFVRPVLSFTVHAGKKAWPFARSESAP